MAPTKPKGNGKKPKVAKPAANGKAAAKKAAAAGTPPHASTEQVRPSDVRRVISENDLRVLLRQCNGTAKEMAELSGSLREKIAYAKEKKHLHTKAFGVVRQLDRMEPEKLAEFLDHFEHYLEIAGLYKRADSVGKLDLQGSAEDADEAAETKPADAAAADEPGRARTLVNPNDLPSPETVAAAADRAEAGNITRPKFGQRADEANLAQVGRGKTH